MSISSVKNCLGYDLIRERSSNSSDGKNKRKAEVVDLAVNAHEMVCDGECEDNGTVDNRRRCFALTGCGFVFAVAREW